jgi:hypothetical protein
MFAAQLLEPVSVNPAWAAVSLALLSGAYALAVMPPKLRRLTVALILVVGVAGGLVFVNEASAQLSFPGLDCCTNWLLIFGICWPPSWGC